MHKAATMHRNLRRQRGMTLTESLLTLGVAAMIAVLAYGGYKMATASVSETDMSNSTTQFISKIKSTWGPLGNFSTVDKLNVISAGTIPKSFMAVAGATPAASTLNDAAGQPIALSGTTTSFAIDFTQSPTSCARFVAQVEGIAYAINVGAAATQASGVGSGGQAVKSAGGTVNAANLMTGCAETNPHVVLTMR